MRIVSDKLSNTLAMTTIDTVQKVGEGKVQVALAKAELRDATIAQKDKSIEMLRTKKAELQARFDELSGSITNHTVFGQGRIIKAFPEIAVKNTARECLHIVQMFFLAIIVKLYFYTS